MKAKLLIQFTTAVLSLLWGLNSMGQECKRPNLVFVFADQLRADVLAYAGDSKAITLNLDVFTRDAVRFTNAVSVSPVCTPYRSSLLTGKYVSSTGMVINELNMSLNHRTIAHVLNDAGYNCAYVGKMHLNDRHSRSYKKGPERFGFDDYWAGYSFHHESYKAYYYTDGEEGQEKRIDLSGKYGPEEFTSLACDYMTAATKKDKPFAMFLSWNPPHDPWTKNNVPADCYEKFATTRFDLPANFKDEPDPYMDRFPHLFFKGDSAWQYEFIHGEGYQETMRCYYAMVHSIDQQFGRIINRLDELGIADNTIVVFTSDHGEMFTSQGRMFKLCFYEEAARIPLLVRAPKQQKAGSNDACINTPDIAPTLLGLMGLKAAIPDEMEGMDLSHLVEGKKGEAPDFALQQGMGHTWQWKDGYEWRAVRDKRYTYGVYRRDGKVFLFDRLKDPYQQRNVAGLPRYQKVEQNLRKQLYDKMAAIKDDYHACTWYRDHWMYKNYSVKEAAQGEFGPLAPVEPTR
ncbi:MAG: sulfatase [Carboxylicivirga sp.]|jgi:arylsulfatase A-like enzyme|nr:sulfatase [Carboxylicivirga sp.]